MVRLTYIEPARGAAEAKSEREIELRFGGVRNLTLAQEEDSADFASSTFEDLTAWPLPSPRFMLRTGNPRAAIRRGFSSLDASADRLSHCCYEA